MSKLQQFMGGAVLLSPSSSPTSLVVRDGYGRVQTIRATDTDGERRLPDARPLRTGGPICYLVNPADATKAWDVADSAGTVLATDVTPGEVVKAALIDNSTAAGVWILTRLQVGDGASAPDPAFRDCAIQFPGGTPGAYLYRPGIAGPSNAFTWAGWVRQLGASGVQVLASHRGKSGAGWHLVADAGTVKLYCEGTLEATGGALTDGPTEPGAWYFVAAEVDGTDCTVYTGTLWQDDLASAAGYGVATITYEDALYSVGGDRWGNGFHGRIAEVGYFSTALGASLIADLYNSGYGTRFATLPIAVRSSLIAYHGMTDCCGGARDETLASRHLWRAGAGALQFCQCGPGGLILDLGEV